GGGGRVRERARPRHRALHHFPAGARALSHRAATLLRLLDAWPPIATVRTRVPLHSRDQLPGSGSGRLVHAPRYADAHLPRYQSAAVLPNRLLLAARSDPRTGARRRPYLPG